MYLGIILLMLLCLILAVLLSVNYHEEMSGFELKRRAEADPEYKKQLTFSKIFPGLNILLVISDWVLTSTIVPRRSGVPANTDRLRTAIAMNRQENFFNIIKLVFEVFPTNSE